MGLYSLDEVGLSRTNLLVSSAIWVSAHSSSHPGAGYCNLTRGSPPSFLSKPSWGKSTYDQLTDQTKQLADLQGRYLSMSFGLLSYPEAQPFLIPLTASSQGMNPTHPLPHSPLSSTRSKHHLSDTNSS